jgi:hypothetical protein
MPMRRKLETNAPASRLQCIPVLGPLLVSVHLWDLRSSSKVNSTWRKRSMMCANSSRRTTPSTKLSVYGKDTHNLGLRTMSCRRKTFAIEPVVSEAIRRSIPTQTIHKCVQESQLDDNICLYSQYWRPFGLDCHGQSH